MRRVKAHTDLTKLAEAQDTQKLLKSAKILKNREEVIKPSESDNRVRCIKVRNSVPNLNSSNDQAKLSNDNIC